MTPIERAARVICERTGRDPAEICIGEGAATGRTWLGWQAFASEARAVIAAIRKPSKTMKRAGADQLLGSANDDWEVDAAAVWSAMIDALINEDPTRSA